MTLNVITGESLDEAGVVEMKQLSADVPALTINEAPSGFSGVSIRGIGTSAGSQAYEQSVGLFADGIYHPRAHQYRDALLDVERVEVVKGSQGVLFGKNSSVGAISVISRGAGTENGGNIQAEYEAEYGGYSLDGGVDIVASDQFKFRLAAYFEEFGGTVKNITLGRDERGGDRYSVRGIFDFEPNDVFSARVKLQKSQYETEGQLTEHIADLNSPALIGTGVLDGGLNDHEIYGGNAFFDNSFEDYESEDHALEMNFNLGGDFTLTSLTGYSEFTWVNQIDADATPLPLSGSGFDDRYEQVTQEIRLTSPDDDTFEYIVGAFYLDSEGSVIGKGIVNEFNLAPGVFLYGEWDNNFSQEQETYAEFGQATWYFTDDWQLNVGGRYTVDEKSATYQRVFLDDFGQASVLAGGANLAPLLVGDTPVLEQDVRDYTFDYSVTLGHNPTEDSTIYLAVGEGNKGSGSRIQQASDLLSQTLSLFPLKRSLLLSLV